MSVNLTTAANRGARAKRREFRTLSGWCVEGVYKLAARRPIDEASGPGFRRDDVYLIRRPGLDPGPL